MDIQKRDNGYFIEDNGKEIGYIELSYAGDAIIIIASTHVDPNYQGQGLASKLVEKVVLQARETNKKVIPLCTYALKQYQTKPEYGDTWNQ